MAYGITRDYKDIDMNFLEHPVTKDIRKKTGVEAIKQALSNLIFLRNYDYRFNPDLGCGIEYVLFENLNLPETELVIKQKIVNIIEEYEPRAELIGIYVDSNKNDGIVEIDVIFKPLNSVLPVEINLVLQIDR